jgi:exosortase A
MNARMPQEVVQNPALTSDQQKLKAVAFLAVATIAAILVAYHDTTWSLISIWARSDTFAHGFLIFPFSAYLIWTQRQRLSELSFQPNPLALLGLGGLGFSWLLATLASVQVFAQFLMIAMIPMSVWAILGNRIVAALAFPLAYLLLAVPFGDAFIPPLIDFTADFTVTALQLTGIPVYREGSFFTIPSGSWSVVEACSGLRYLIASFTLGTLYAYLTYRSIKRRVIFIALSLIVPLIANGIRAYMIVMTGHLSDMKLAVGVDHLIYGWIFFGIVMLLLFWIGSFWRQDGNEFEYSSLTASSAALNNAHSSNTLPLKKAIYAAFAVLVIASVWPIYANQLEKIFSQKAEPAEIQIPGVVGTWQYRPEEVSDWRPQYLGFAAQFMGNYRNGDRSVDLYIAYYRNQRQGAELINWENVLVPSAESNWHNIKEEARIVFLGLREATIRQNQLHSGSKRLLVWRWYWIDGEETANPYHAKFMLGKNKMLGRGDDGAEIIITAPYQEDANEAVPVLQGFINDMRPVIMEGLGNAGSR